MNYIQNQDIKKYATYLVNHLPDYFFEVAASSTGKYHPIYALGSGGLVRHTKAAVQIAIELFKLDFWPFDQDEKDSIVTALLLHDGWKHGDMDATSYTTFDHPLIAANHVRDMLSSSDCNCTIPCVEMIAKLIESHMGQWNTSKYSKVELPLPTTEAQQFTHLCDYLASRKFLTFEFDEYYEPHKYSTEEDLIDGINELVVLCKQLIHDGADRSLIYKTIAQNNDGRMNPNTIKSEAVLKKVMEAVKTLAG